MKSVNINHSGVEVEGTRVRTSDILAATDQPQVGDYSVSIMARLRICEMAVGLVRLPREIGRAHV